MAVDTKPNLASTKFEQCVGDILLLSGCTDVYGEMGIRSTGIIDSHSGYKVSGVTMFDAGSNYISAIQIGQSAQASNTGAIAMGAFSKSNITYGIAIGYQACATSSGNIAIGNAACATGATTINIGGNVVCGSQNTVVGNNANAKGISVAIGANANTCSSGIAIGTGSNAGLGAVTVGTNANASTTYAIGVGYGIISSGLNSIVLGNNGTCADNTCAISIGIATIGKGTDSIVIGANSCSLCACDITLGKAIQNCSLYGGIAIGANIVTCGGYNIAIGNGSCAWCFDSIAIGEVSVAKCDFSIAIGRLNKSCACDTITMGQANESYGKCSNIIGGYNNKICSGNTSTTLIGESNKTLTGSSYSGYVVVPNLAIYQTPSGSGNILCWNATSKKVGVTSTGGLGAITGATNGLGVTGAKIKLGGTLTGTTIINTNAQLLCICGGVVATDFSFNAYAGSYYLMTAGDSGACWRNIVDSNKYTWCHMTDNSNGSCLDISNSNIVLTNKAASISKSATLGINALIYGGDYSSCFISRSLVDKAYVTGLTSNYVCTATNGITKNGQNVKWGGTLTGNTYIDGAKELYFGLSTKLTDFYVGTNSFIQLTVSGGSANLLMLPNSASLCSKSVSLAVTGNTAGIYLTGSTISTIGAIRICTTPSTGVCTDSVLVWNSTDKTIKKLPYSSGGTASGERVTKYITKASHGFNVNDVLGWSGGTYNKAIANGTYDGEVLGIVSKCYDINNFDLTQAGYVSGLTGLVANTTYFLSPTTAGQLTSTEPTTDGHISKAVLIADSSASGWVLPYAGYVVTTGGTGGGGAADNGLSMNGNTVELGGRLCKNTTICGNNYPFVFTGGTSTCLEAKSTYIGSRTGATTNGIQFSNTSMIVSDAISSKGLAYAGNYCTNSGTNPRWIPDAAWVTGTTYSIATYNQDPTGFLNNTNIVASYDRTNRTVTLSAVTGTVRYLWNGVLHDLGTSWTSSGHTNNTNTWFLYSDDGSNFKWTSTPWEYTTVQVAARPSNTCFAIREVHATMPWTAHQEFHQTIGTYRLSGFGFTNGTYDLQPTVPSNSGNTIGFEAGVVKDEDNSTSIAAWIEGSYTQLYFSSASTYNLLTGQTAIFRLGTTYPKYNPYDGSLFSETEMVSGNYANWYVIRIPVTMDASSQLYRAVIVQPQFTYTSLASAQAENPQNLYLGGLSSYLAEYVLVERITLRTNSGYTGASGRVRIEALSLLSGTRFSQTNTTVGLGVVTAGNVTVAPQSPFTATNLQSLSDAYASCITAIKTNYITGATNLGSGNGTLFTTVSGNKVQLKTLTGGTNISLTTDGTYITINSTGGGSSASGERVTKLINQVSHGFVAKDVLGWSGGTYNKAIADGTYDGEIVGLVSKCYNADCFELTQSGYVTGLTSLSINNTYFLSDITAGLLTTTPPTLAGRIVKSVLIANSSTSGWVLPYAGYRLSVSSSTMSEYTITGNSSTTGFTINHAKNKQFVAVEVVKNSSPYATVYTTVLRPNANCICVTFDTAPATGQQYKILIIN